MSSPIAPSRHQFALLAGITALGSLAIQLFVPAMPQAAADLMVSPSAIQLAVTFYLAGVATGQVVSGPLSDRWGQRPVLLGGITLFTLGSLICWLAPSIAWLLTGRLVQAAGGAAGLVVSRSVAGSASGRGARDMALLTAIVMLSPMLAPVLGSLLVLAGGWRTIFAVLTTISLVCGAMAVRWLHPLKTNPRHTDGIAHGIARIVASGHFLRHLSLGTSISSGLYVFLTSSSFLFVGYYHAPSEWLGAFYGAVALGAALGALTASRVSDRVGAIITMRLGAMIAAFGAAMLGSGALGGWHHVAWLVVPMAVFSFGGGLVTPNAMVAALEANPGRVGTVVSAYGALQMLGNGLASAIMAAIAPRTPLPVAIAIALFAAITVALAAREPRQLSIKKQR